MDATHAISTIAAATARRSSATERIASRIHALTLASDTELASVADELVELIFRRPDGGAAIDPVLVRRLGGLQEQLERLSSGTPLNPTGQRDLAAWRIATDPTLATADGIAERVREMIRRDPDSLGRRDWIELRELLATEPGRSLGGTRSLPALTLSLPAHLDDLIYRRAPIGHGIRTYVDELRIALLPERRARIASALDAIAASREPTRLDHELLLYSMSADLERLGFPAAVVDAAASHRLLAMPDPPNPLHAARLLDSARRVIDRALARSNDPATRQVVADATELLDRNVMRIGGTRFDDSVKGLHGHPDYAEVGRLRQQALLAQRVADANAAAATTVTW